MSRLDDMLRFSGPCLLAEALSALSGDAPWPAFQIEALIDRMGARR